MYMLQHYDKARQRLLEIHAREERRIKLAVESGMSSEELEMLEKEAAEARKASSDGEVEKPDSDKPAKKAKKPVAKAKGKMMSFDKDED
jgi:imidazolonepropionase-like amidohydrolase